MKKSWLAVSAVALASALGAGAYINQSEASDHDDGERDIKSRALNLTDHFAFKSPTAPGELSLIMYFNPRALPGKQYFLSPNARYEFHVTRVATRTTAPAPKNDFVFRFVAKEPVGDVQDITLTVFKEGTRVGEVTGKSTDFLTSKKNTGLTINMGTAGPLTDLKFFVGMRADSFFFDVNRFFQVRTFLASRFFGGAGGAGNAGAGLAPNCKGDAFLANILVPGSDATDGDGVNLFNPPSCAPDFTKNLNVTAIVLNVKIADLGGTIFDTWSTISVKQ
ncbi:MAG: DUF4331 family protein [Deltaproteobacteria bacterium]|nr:DUF4331 family protein [Deltaproteobacteria bacterium]